MRRIPILVALGLVLAACSGSGGDSEPPETLRLITHDSFASAAVEGGVFDDFTTASGVDVEVIAAGDSGTLVNQAILSKDNPLADVLFGIDDNLLSRALDEDLFAQYTSTHIGDVGDELTRDDNLVTPIDFGDVCINYDKEWFNTTKIQVPKTLDDLRAQLYASHLTVQHPATSSPGLAFMLATIDVFGEAGWLDYWAQLRDNDVSVAGDWDSAYYAEFSRYGGRSSLVVSYASSPPAEVIFSTEPLTEAPTGIIEDGCYRQVEYVGVLTGTEYPDEAGQLIDYMLSVDFQERIPLTWFVFPANQKAELPAEFAEHAVIPTNPSRLDAEFIAQNRDRWIDEWIEVMEG